MRDATRRKTPPVSFLFAVAFAVLLSACGRLDAEDVIRPDVLDAALGARTDAPFERADVSLTLRLEAGANADGKHITLEWVRLFEGSGLRTTEPALELRLRMPEDAEAPFLAGEVRTVVLDGYVPNEDLARFCDRTLRLMVATRTTGVHGLVGVAEDVTVGCDE